MSDLVYNPEMHEYFLDDQRLPSVTQVLSSTGILDFSQIPAHLLEAACERGDEVHEALRYHDEGFYEPEGEEPYLRAYVQFKNDMGFVPALIEHSVYHRNPDYAGTLDRWGPANGEAGVLMEFKTGGKMAAHKVQLAGYGIALQYSEPDRPLTARWLVYFHPGKGRGYSIESISAVEQINLYGIFAAALAVHNFKEANDGR